MKCHCGEIYSAREADLNRGWGLSCSKRCAAIKRNYGRSNAVRLDGKKLSLSVKGMNKIRDVINDKREYGNVDDYINDYHDNYEHPFSGEGIGQDGY